MSSTQTSGLTRRRGGGGGGNAANGDGEQGSGIGRSNSSANIKDSAPETSYESSENGHKIAFDPRDINESAERSKQPKLTLMEEVLLLGLKDKQVSYMESAKVACTPVKHAANLEYLNNALTIRVRVVSNCRAISLSGMTTFPTLSAAALFSSLPSAAVSACKRTPREGDSRYPTASLKSSMTPSPAKFCSTRR
jgi:hypothetical protein